MRIISGILIGKKILQPIDIKTRPLKDMVKESIFNILKHSKKINFQIENSNILDLFSGTGSFGFECISRGAKKITFVEYHKNAIKILRKNIFNLKIENECEVIENDCFSFLDTLDNLKKQYNIIFLDPPYKEEKIDKIINLIRKKKLLISDGIVIIHRHKNEVNNLSGTLKILDSRIYGISKIIIGN